MAKNTNMLPWIFLMIFVVLVAGIAVLLVSGSPLTQGLNPYSKTVEKIDPITGEVVHEIIYADAVQCDVIVQKSFCDGLISCKLTSANIKSVNCKRFEKCSQFKIQNLNFFTVQGNLKMQDSTGNLDTMSFEVPILPFVSDTYTLEGCSFDEEVRIVLTDTDGNLLDERYA